MPAIEFTLMVGCPLKCTFCPQDRLRGEYGKSAKYMTPDTFRTILAKIPTHVRIDFSGMAEPWANPHATEMMRHALLSGYTIAVYSTLFGMDADGPEVAELLKHHASQVEVLCLHLPDRNGNMRGWRYGPEYEANLRLFIAMGVAGTWKNFQVMTMDRTGKPHADLDHLGIQLGAWQGHSRAGNVANSDVLGQDLASQPEHHTAVSCAFTPFYDQNVCLPNGDVVLCCMDYALKHKIGNLIEQDYYDMFSSPRMGELVRENMTPRFSNQSLCKTCDRAKLHFIGPTRQYWHSAA